MQFFSFCNRVIIYEKHFPGAQTLLPKNVKWGFKLSHCAGFQRTFLKIKNPLNELVCLGKLPPQIVEMELISISSFLNYLLPVEYILLLLECILPANVVDPLNRNFSSISSLMDSGLCNTIFAQHIFHWKCEIHLLIISIENLPAAALHSRRIQYIMFAKKIWTLHIGC